MYIFDHELAHDYVVFTVLEMTLFSFIYHCLKINTRFARSARFARSVSSARIAKDLSYLRDLQDLRSLRDLRNMHELRDLRLENFTVFLGEISKYHLFP